MRKINLIVDTDLDEEELIEQIQEALEDSDIDLAVIRVSPEDEPQEENEDG